MLFTPPSSASRIANVCVSIISDCLDPHSRSCPRSILKSDFSWKHPFWLSLILRRDWLRIGELKIIAIKARFNECAWFVNSIIVLRLSTTCYYMVVCFAINHCSTSFSSIICTSCWGDNKWCLVSLLRYKYLYLIWVIS